MQDCILTIIHIYAFKKNICDKHVFTLFISTHYLPDKYVIFVLYAIALFQLLIERWNRLKKEKQIRLNTFDLAN